MTAVARAAGLAERFPFVREGEPLGPRTSLGVGGRAELFAEPPDAPALAAFLREASALGIPVRFLGGGSNTLVPDGGVRGAVVSLLRLRSLAREGGRVRAGAGFRLQDLARRTIRWGLSGLHRLTGIPGTVGGAARMNAGGRHGEFGAFVSALEVAHPDGRIEEIGRDRLSFSYREGRFPGACASAVVLELPPGDPAALRAEHDEILREKKASQPLAAQSAGCIFKNPPGGSAGRLIEAAGMKGRRVGGASVSEVHANFIVTGPAAAAADVLALARAVAAAVEARFGVRLEREVQAW